MLRKGISEAWSSGFYLTALILGLYIYWHLKVKGSTVRVGMELSHFAIDLLALWAMVNVR